MKTKILLSLTIACIVMLMIYSCSKSGGYSATPPPGGNSTTVNISGMAFPASTTVAKGTTVKWYNMDGYAHTVTSDDGTSFNSGNLSAGASFSYVAKTAGTFTYHCNIHSNMHGSLTVNP